MTLGIKVGPQAKSFDDLQQTNAPFAEVWFNILKKDEYTDLFAEMRRRKMTVGLHFWGHLPDQTWANIALPNKTIVKESLKLMKDTIEVAAKHNYQYVNIHPSTRAQVAIDFSTESFRVLSEPIDEHTSEEIFFENLTTLNDYAKRKGVLLTIETIPSKDTNGWRGTENRKYPFDLYSLPNSVVVKAATEGFTVANDFGHTTCTVQSDNRGYVWSTLVQMTKKLFTQTKLLHLGYVIPPYNGTDYHDHFDNPIFETDKAVPNKMEMIELLRMFQDRSDVYALVEPDGRHAENYFLAQKMIQF